MPCLMCHPLSARGAVSLVSSSIRSWCRVTCVILRLLVMPYLLCHPLSACNAVSLVSYSVRSWCRVFCVILCLLVVPRLVCHPLVNSLDGCFTFCSHPHLFQTNHRTASRCRVSCVILCLLVMPCHLCHSLSARDAVSLVSFSVCSREPREFE